jgi:hypothetical protein
LTRRATEVVGAPPLHPSQRGAAALRVVPSWRTQITSDVAVALALLGSGIVVWALSLDTIALDDMTDVGLASALPLGIWVSFGLVTAGCAVAWRTGRSVLMAAGVLSTILVLHGLGVLGEPTMRFVVSWQHVGIADYIATHGSVDPRIDAYFNWPGFFVLTAFLSDVAGLENAEPIARYAPLFYNAMYLVPLLVIGRALFEDARLIWLGIWLFFVNNWIGQDYYSPQGLGLFMYLVVLAVLLRWFKSAPPAFRPGQRWWRLREGLAARATRIADAPSEPAQRVVLIGAIVLVMAAAVASHQLTPFAIVAAVTALVLIEWCGSRTLPVALSLIALLWTSYLATTYLDGHLSTLAQDIGAVDTSLDRNVAGRLHGSAGHELVVRVRVAAAALLWLAAAAGFVRGARRGYARPAVAVLAVAPFPLLGLQSYGGEVVLRIALFAMPFMAFLAASLFVPPARAPMTRPAMVVLAVVALGLMVVFPFTRYGNERAEYFSPDEVAGVQQLYRLAPVGSVLVAGSEVLPWRYTRYTDYDYRGLTSERSSVDLDVRDPAVLAETVVERLRPPAGRQSFLIITRSMKAQAELFGTFRRGDLDRLERVLAGSARFRVAFRNDDATVFALRPGA